MGINPVMLRGKFVQLEPLGEEHITGLAEVANDPIIWKYMLYGNVDTVEKMGDWVHDMLNRQAAGTDLPFAVRQLQTGLLVGATRYLEIRLPQRGLEIGGTWYGTQYQRTVVNTETKLLLLQYAFETLGCIRVQIKTDSRNERSLKAIERLGAVREGTLRNHMVLENGVIRHSVMFSILDNEWQEVKKNLQERLAQ